MAKTASKKRKVIVESIGEAHVTASFNNIIISLTNTKGEVISWSSAGKMGFRGSKKNTPYAAQTAAEDCSKVAQEAGLRKVKVFVKGPGNGRGQNQQFDHYIIVELKCLRSLMLLHSHITDVGLRKDEEYNN